MKKLKKLKRLKVKELIAVKEYIKIFNNYKLLGRSFWWYLFFGVLAQGFIIVLPKIIEQVIHVIDVTKDINQLYIYLVYFGLAVILFTVFNRLHSVKGDKLLHDVYINRQIYYRSKFLQMDYKNVQDVGTGKGISKISQGIDSEAEIFHSLSQILLHAVIKGSILLIIISFLEPILLLIIVIAILLIFVMNKIFYKKLKPITKRIHSTYEQNSRDIVRCIAEHLLIKVSNKKDFELKRGFKNIKNLPKDEATAGFYQYSFYDVLFMLVKFCEIIIYAYVGILIIQGSYPISYMMLLTGYLFAFWWPIEVSILELSHINRHMVKYQKLQEFINQSNDIENGKSKFHLNHGKIVFDNVSFGYNGKDDANIKNCNIIFDAKKTTALVGPSGSGKSTIVKLLLRLYDVRKGEISIDGQKLKNIKLESLYQHVAYIPQEPSIFDGSVRENLMYAFSVNEIVDDEKIWKALISAQAKKFVVKLKDGLDTQIGERGIVLSGGERQRLALARIFLKNPEILILDEPTSALDSEAESKITEVLNKVMKNRTVIIIAHRLQTVRNADKIIVLKNASVKEQGTHDELLKAGKTYANLVKLQNGL